MRLIFWTLGSLLASLAIMAFAFASFSFLVLGQWRFISTNELWARLELSGTAAGASLGKGLSDTLMGMLPQADWVGMFDTYLVAPVFDMGFVFLMALLGAFFMYVGRYREPDYF